MAHLGNTIINGSMRVLGDSYLTKLNNSTVPNYPAFSDTYDMLKYNRAIKAGANGITYDNIIVADADGLYKNLKLGTPFNIMYPILYCGATVGASTTSQNNWLIRMVNLQTTQSITLTLFKPEFIKGTLSGSIFTPIGTAPLTQTIPSTEDNFQYLLLGIAYHNEAIYLTEDHRIFQYTNGAFRDYYCAYADSSINQVLDASY